MITSFAKYSRCRFFLLAKDVVAMLSSIGYEPNIIGMMQTTIRKVCKALLERYVNHYEKGM